jgi:hypothetical protein
MIDISNVMKIQYGKPGKNHVAGIGMTMAVLIYRFLRFVDYFCERAAIKLNLVLSIPFLSRI